MNLTNKQIEFFNSEAGKDAKRQLELMVSDDRYSTRASFSANKERYADNKIPFIDKHMHYLSIHPSLKPEHYISNLRISTRIR